jgi:hypothetical protein
VTIAPFPPGVKNAPAVVKTVTVQAEPQDRGDCICGAHLWMFVTLAVFVIGSIAFLIVSSILDGRRPAPPVDKPPAAPPADPPSEGV